MLIDQIAGRPWAIRSEIAYHVRGLLAREGFAGLRHLAALKAEIHSEGIEARRGSGPKTAGQIALIPVMGTLTQRPEIIRSEETRSTEAVAFEVKSAVADPNVDAVVLEIESPGGSVFGVPEAWEEIRKAAKVKPVVAIANSVAASAAYYLMSAASEAWITPSGMVGSVGVFALHVDESKALEAAGERWDFIVATDSPFKVEGNPTVPLTKEAREYLQRDVDRYMGMFVDHVAKGRGVSTSAVLKRFGGGRMLGAQDAVAAKMADGVGTLEVAIRRAAQLARERGDGGGARAESVTGFGEPLLPLMRREVAQALASEFREVRQLEPEPPEPDPEPEPVGQTPAQRAALDRLRAL
jgi:signal peptide peptidase SppA